MASAFIVFTMPYSQVSRARLLISSYIIGIITAGICTYISHRGFLVHIAVMEKFSYSIFGALAVGLAIFIMVITNSEHPPAAGLALGLVLNEWDIRAIAVALIGIISLSLIKTVLKPYMQNLL